MSHTSKRRGISLRCWLSIAQLRALGRCRSSADEKQVLFLGMGVLTRLLRSTRHLRKSRVRAHITADSQGSSYVVAPDSGRRVQKPNLKSSAPRHFRNRSHLGTVITRIYDDLFAPEWFLPFH